MLVAKRYTDSIALFYARIWRDEAAKQGLELSEAGMTREAGVELKEAARWDREAKRIEKALGHARGTRTATPGRGD